MRLHTLPIVFALTSTASSAAAQTTHCMRMGSDMVNCTGPDGSNTNCMRMGADMATCQTTGGTSYNSSDGGAAAGAGLVDIIRGFQERSFRSKVGKMIAAGDCTGAVRYAVEKGKFEVAASLQILCSQSAQAPAVSSLPTRIKQVASSIKTPMEFDPKTSLTHVGARDSSLLLTLVSSDKSFDLSAHESKWKADACSTQSTRTMLEAGASLKVVYFSPEYAKNLGAFIVSGSDCKT